MFKLNLPNFLTLVRILLVPVVVVALLERTPDGDLLAAGVFAIASVTDLLDGYLARSRDRVTSFGKLMDPVADKLLVVAALLALVSLHRLEPWVAMVIIAREFAVTATRLAVLQAGVVVSANRWGKAKTVTQVSTVFLLIAVTGRPVWLDVLIDLTVLVTVLSGVDYFFGLRRRLSEAQARARRAAEQASRAGAL